ncbi:MAG: NosD domain-containing protein [Thermoplasmata archaeon]
MVWRTMATASIVIFALMTTSIGAVMILRPGIYSEEPEYKARPGIVIDGNGDFSHTSGVVRGTGVPWDPYLIEGWRITGGSILIRNTSLSFVISKVVVDKPRLGFGIGLMNVSGGMIKDCCVEEAAAGIVIGQDTGGTCSNITISNVSVRSCSEGLLAQNSENITVTDCIFAKTWLTAMCFIRCRNTTAVQNFAMTTTRYLDGVIKPVFLVSNCSRVSAIKNIITNNYEEGLWIENSTDTVLIANEFRQCHVRGIRLTFCTDTVIADNHLIGEDYPSPKACGIMFQSSDLSEITNNTLHRGFITGLSFRGLSISSNKFTYGGNIYLDDFHDVVIANNSLDGMGPSSYMPQPHEIALRGGANASICGNVLTRFDHHGILVENSTLVSVIGNMARGNQSLEELISLRNSFNVTLANNSVWNAAKSLNVSLCSDIALHGNNFSGGQLLFSGCSKMMIVRNIFTDIALLEIDDCSREVAYGNVFYGPDLRIVDSGVGTWNSTYPEGGNYYSFHVSIDEFRGPNQDVPGADGIGDVPFSIDSDSIDYYPLTAPPEFYDTEPPTLAINLYGICSRSGWFQSSVSVSVAAADLVSGVRSVMYRVDGNEYSEYTSELLLDSEGTHMLDVHAVDNKGNSGPVQSVLIRIDWTPPECISIEPLNGSVIYASWVTVSCEFVDNESGVSYWMIAYGSEYVLSKSPSECFFDLKPGYHEFFLQAQDEAGNILYDNGLWIYVETRARNDNLLSKDGPYGPWILTAIAIDVCVGLLAVVVLVKLGMKEKKGPEQEIDKSNGPSC